MCSPVFHATLVHESQKHAARWSGYQHDGLVLRYPPFRSGDTCEESKTMRYLQRGLTHHDPKRATPGFTLYTPLRNTTASLVNMAGAIVHQWDLPAEPSNYGYLLPNGNRLIALRSADGPHDLARGASVGS